MQEKQTFLVEIKDVSGSLYYFRTTAIDESYAIDTVATILTKFTDDNKFMKVFRDTDCYFEFYINREKIIGFRIVNDLMTS